MSTLYIAHSVKEYRVCFTHYDKNKLINILLTLGAFHKGLTSLHSLTEDQKESWLTRFEFSERIIEDN